MEKKIIAFFTAFSIMFAGSATEVYASEADNINTEIGISIDDHNVDVEATGIRMSDEKLEKIIENDLSRSRATIDGTSNVFLYGDGSIEINAETEYRKETYADTYSVINFSLIDENNAVVELYSHQTKTSFIFDTRTPIHKAVGTTEIAPVVAAVLSALARFGIKYAIKAYGKAQLKKTIKSHVLSLNKNKWSHIMAPKHAWNRVGAKNKNQVADLISRAVTEGTKSGNTVTWKYKGQTIKVTLGPSGQVGNAWVVTR